jgi:hypothetical protein
MSKSNADWFKLEQLIKVIENSIDPTSRVEHDVMLPSLTSGIGSKRQCDLIIRTGNPPRETITLVEVQRRNKKVDILVFDGWIQKMREIGAQHLICVSISGFPDSIKDRAKQLGGTVRLILFTNPDIKTLPIKIFGFNYSFSEYSFSYKSEVKIKGLDHNKKIFQNLKFHTDDKIFHGTDKMGTSISDLINIYLQKNNITEAGQRLVQLPEDGDRLFIKVKGKLARIKLLCDIDFQVKKEDVPVDLWNYEQVGDGTLAWMFTGTLKYKNLNYTVSVPTIQNQDGSFRVSNMQISVQPT